MLSPRAIIALIGISGASPLMAETWIDYGESGDGSVYAIDLDTMEISGSTVTVWSRADHSKNKNEAARETKHQYRIYCPDKTVTLLYYVSYRPNGSVINSHMLSYYERESRPAVPGSIGETLVQLVCPES